MVCALGGLVILTSGKRPVTNLYSTGTNIICFGDSITRGHGVDAKAAYPALLASMTGLPVINAGMDGDTSSEGLKRLDSDVLEREPLLVIIGFGGNDFLQKLPLEETVKNISEMIDRIQARGAMVALFDISAPLLMPHYRKPFSDLAKTKSLIFIPNVLSGVLTDPAMKSDFVHPNGLGYRAIAHRVYRSILPYINRNMIARKFKK